MVYASKGGSAMGRTNIVLDENLVKKAIRLTGAKSKREVVDLALKKLVQNADFYEGIRSLRGKLKWEGDLKTMRRNRVDLR
jgi:Arc/MetJ family transcription regulator